MSRSSEPSPPARQFRRLREIATILVRHGFADVLARLRLERYLAFGRRIVFPRRPRATERLTQAQRLRLSIEALGPTFIKFGQALSTRADVLPPDFVTEFSRLQDEVPPLAPGEAETAIERELGVSLASVFSEFDPTPIAAASIAQVHRARLGSGAEVAVKVRRPGISSVIESDLAIMGYLARLAERYLPDADVYRPSMLVHQFALSIRREQDLAREGRTIGLFAQNFAGDPTVHFPAVHWAHTTSGVLTMEYIHGTKLSDILAGRATGDRKLLARRGAEVMLKQILLHGVFHADPHPANVFVLPENVICLLDFGNIGRMDRQSARADREAGRIGGAPGRGRSDRRGRRPCRGDRRQPGGALQRSRRDARVVLRGRPWQPADRRDAPRHFRGDGPPSTADAAGPAAAGAGAGRERRGGPSGSIPISTWPRPPGRWSNGSCASASRQRR